MGRKGTNMIVTEVYPFLDTIVLGLGTVIVTLAIAVGIYEWLDKE